MEDQRSIDLNVVILPNEELNDIFINWSKEAAQNFRTELVLNKKDCLPHLSLYQGRYPKKNVEKIKEKLKVALQGISSFSIKMKGFSAYHAFIFYDAIKNDPLLNLQKRVIESLSELREGMILPGYQQYLAEKLVSEERLENIRRYGYPHCFENYIPHLSITRLKDDEQARKGITRLPQVELDLIVNKVALVLIGDHGTCASVLKEYNLGKDNQDVI